MSDLEIVAVVLLGVAAFAVVAGTMVMAYCGMNMGREPPPPVLPPAPPPFQPRREA